MKLLLVHQPAGMIHLMTLVRIDLGVVRVLLLDSHLLLLSEAHLMLLISLSVLLLLLNSHLLLLVDVSGDVVRLLVRLVGVVVMLRYLLIDLLMVALVLLLLVLLIVGVLHHGGGEEGRVDVRLRVYFERGHVFEQRVLHFAVQHL